jgi:protein-L-isoaspartate(D-aspartate) O-methyltransferase
MKNKLINYWQSSGLIKDKKVIGAFKQIPREEFILEGYEKEAYGDYPLPIGYEQTISQPTTVLMMIEALQLNGEDRVLEIGAGSGYNAAIMSRLCKIVIATEIIPELVEFAKNNIKKINIKNVKIVHHDGSLGYEKEAPYDKIIVTAACPKIPKPLIEQLKQGGIILAPIGDFFGQKMIKGIKKEGKLEFSSIGYFQFVPLKGKYGY